MRATGLILLAVFLLVGAKSDAQQLMVISVKKVKLQRFMSEIEKQMDYVFFYDASLLKNAKPITVDLRGAPVNAVLDEALGQQNIEYCIIDKTIFLKRRSRSTAKVNFSNRLPGGRSSLGDMQTNTQ